jgi:indolepyruvate ferredoxin oxidoreductase beta subunit
MGEIGLSYEPYNLIITGVGGQGNVLASRMVGDMLSRSGFYVTIGETFGASQRGGSVMSHLRISTLGTKSPQVPRGRANMIVSLEPTEALRVLKDYGNPKVKIICNTRPIYSIGVICGDQRYPGMDDLKKWIEELSEESWFINATDGALQLGNPIFGNIISVGALAATGVLPLTRESFRSVLSEKMTSDKVSINLSAYDMGVGMIQA